MLFKLYLLAGLLSHATMFGLLLRFLENANVSVRESLTGVLSQGAILLQELGVVVEDVGYVDYTFLPAEEVVVVNEDAGFGEAEELELAQAEEDAADAEFVEEVADLIGSRD